MLIFPVIIPIISLKSAYRLKDWSLTTTMHVQRCRLTYVFVEGFNSVEVHQGVVHHENRYMRDDQWEELVRFRSLIID